MSKLVIANMIMFFLFIVDSKFKILHSRLEQKKNCTFEIYVTAVNPCRGFFDNGIFHFPLMRKSILVPKDEVQYGYTRKLDYYHELFYCSIDSVDLELLRIDAVKGKNIKGKKKNGRIMIIIYEEQDVDTLFIIGSRWDYTYKDRYIKRGNEKLKKMILSVMPPELRDNWEQVIPCGITDSTEFIIEKSR